MDEEFVDPNEHYANREITTPENRSGDDDEPATLYRVVGWLALSAVILTVGYSYADMDWLFGSNDQTAQIESSIPRAQLQGCRINLPEPKLLRTRFRK